MALHPPSSFLTPPYPKLYPAYTEWTNFTALYGLKGGDGLLNYRVYEGRGCVCKQLSFARTRILLHAQGRAFMYPHAICSPLFLTSLIFAPAAATTTAGACFEHPAPQGAPDASEKRPLTLPTTQTHTHTHTHASRITLDGRSNTSSKMPNDCETVPSRAVAARNALRQADPAFSIDAVSSTGLHYSWTWNLTGACRLHFVHLNLFPGHACGSPENPGHEGKTPGFSCGGEGWMGPEDSLGFLEADLAAHASQPGTHVVRGSPIERAPARARQHAT